MFFMKRKIKWGILGCASIAERAMLSAIKSVKNGVTYGIASRDFKKAQAWKNAHKFVVAYPDYQSMIDDPMVDAVYIPLANHLHCEWAIRAAKAGKHVLVEKPFAMNAEEARKMAEAAQSTNVIMMEAFMYKYHVQNEKALRYIRKNDLGDIRWLHSSFTFDYPVDVDNYRWHPEFGGGALYDVGCYTVSVARMMFEEEPVSVYATARIHPKYGIDTSATLHLNFPKGKVAQLDCSFESTFQSYFEVVGTTGRMVVDRAFSQKMRDTNIFVYQSDMVKKAVIRRQDPYARMIDDIQESIRHNRQARFGTSDAISNMKVLDAAFKSIKTGKEIPIE